MPTIADTNSDSPIKAAYSSSFPAKRDSYKKSSVDNLSSPAYSVEISGEGKQQTKNDVTLDKNREQSEFERSQDQRILNFQRNKQAEAQEFKRNQRQGEIDFKQKMQQKEAEFNRKLREDEFAFKQKQQRAAAKIIRDRSTVQETS